MWPPSHRNSNGGRGGGKRGRRPPNLRATRDNIVRERQRHGKDHFHHDFYDPTGPLFAQPYNVEDDSARSLHDRQFRQSPRNFHPPLQSYDGDGDDYDHDHDLLLRKDDNSNQYLFLEDSRPHLDERLNVVTKRNTSKGKDLHYHSANGHLPSFAAPSSWDGNLNGKRIGGGDPSNSMYLDDGHPSPPPCTLLSRRNYAVSADGHDNDSQYSEQQRVDESYIEGQKRRLLSRDIPHSDSHLPAPKQRIFGVSLSSGTLKDGELHGHKDVRHTDHVGGGYNRRERYSSDISYSGLPLSRRSSTGLVLSSSQPEDDYLCAYEDSFQPSRASNVRHVASGSGEYNQKEIFKRARQQSVRPSVNCESHDYMFPEEAKKKKPDHSFDGQLLVSDDYNQRHILNSVKPRLVDHFSNSETNDFVCFGDSRKESYDHKFRDEPSGSNEYSRRQVFNTARHQLDDPLVNSEIHDYAYPVDARKERYVHNFRGETSRPDEYNQRQFFDIAKHRPLSPFSNGKSRDYKYSSDARRESIDHDLATLSGSYLHEIGRTKEDYPDIMREALINSYEERVENFEASPNIPRTSNLREHGALLKRRNIQDYDTMRNAQDGSSLISETFEFGRSYLDHKITETEGSHEYLRDDSLEDYRQSSRSPHSYDQSMEFCAGDISPERMSNVEYGDMYDHDPQYDHILLRRQYTMDEKDWIDQRIIFPSTRKRNAMMDRTVDNGLWTSDVRMCLGSSKKFGFGRPRFRTFTRRVPVSDPCSTHSSRSDRNTNLKKRMKPYPLDSHVYSQSNKKTDSQKFNKLHNKNTDIIHGFEKAHDDDSVDESYLKIDIDSEEFKKQVHKCFLQFSKLLNENSDYQKKIRANGTTGSLLCYVCGSLSKEFADTHSLVMHTYDCLKTRVRADHLGLHKAVCVLMGWSWQVAPDNAKAYQSNFGEEVKAWKEDLIIWPPLVIVHSSLIGNNDTANNGQNTINTEGLGEILRGMGYASGKTQICQGEPSNKNVMLVKFSPTFSGLQEAENLHKYYVDSQRGRKEFQEISSPEDSTTQITEAQGEQLLYGFLATSEDMNNLDLETKKRCVVKSKKDIEAIAAAALTS